MELTGIIVEESLDDNRILNNFKITNVKITNQDNPKDRWHLYEVIIQESQLDSLSNHIIQGWYMHFWHADKVIAIFKSKRFRFDYKNKESWKEVLEYGRSLGIPEQQLDFPITGL